MAVEAIQTWHYGALIERRLYFFGWPGRPDTIRQRALMVGVRHYYIFSLTVMACDNTTNSSHQLILSNSNWRHDFFNFLTGCGNSALEPHSSHEVPGWGKAMYTMAVGLNANWTTSHQTLWPYLNEHASNEDVSFHTMRCQRQRASGGTMQSNTRTQAHTGAQHGKHACHITWQRTNAIVQDIKSAKGVACLHCYRQSHVYAWSNGILNMVHGNRVPGLIYHLECCQANIKPNSPSNVASNAEVVSSLARVLQIQRWQKTTTTAAPAPAAPATTTTWWSYRKKIDITSH